MVVKEIPEFHQMGNLTLENLDLFKDILDASHKADADVGLQVASDGRIWVCIEGMAFLRFSPHPNGRMSRS
jgi:hypothetical protein